jgi:hypothetical protein
MRRTLFLGIALTACTAASERADQTIPTPSGTSTGVVAVAGGVIAPNDSTSRLRRDTAARATPALQAAPRTVDRQMPVIRALYVNRFAAQSKRRMSQLMTMVDTTELNGLVVDMKDEFGLNYKSANPSFARNAGGTHGFVPDVRALVDSMHAHKIFAIARIVTFKDPVAARVNTQWTIKRQDGSIWRDKEGLAWVNPYHRELWEYNIGVAEELVALGFDEIQWDYIRFPEPYKSLPQQVFPASNGMSKPDALAAYLKEAKARLNKLGVRSTADIFGLVTTVRGPLEVGQWWEKLAPVSDVLLPMVYPSHYPRGSFGVARPNAEPYKIIKAAITPVKERDAKLGITTPEHVRPWLQAFSLGQPPYDASHIREQKRAVYDAGYQGWVLWHPGSKYEIFLAGLDKKDP